MFSSSTWGVKRHPRPDEIQYIISSACSGFTPVCPTSRMCRANLVKKVAKDEPSDLALYFNKEVTPASREKSFQQSYSFCLYPNLTAIDEGWNVDELVNHKHSLIRERDPEILELLYLG